MNSVRLNGRFCKVTAYTNGTVQIVDSADSSCYFDKKEDYVKGTFLTEDDAWIEVRMSYETFNDFDKEGMFKRPSMFIEGSLQTEIGYGSGIVNTFVRID